MLPQAKALTSEIPDNVPFPAPIAIGAGLGVSAAHEVIVLDKVQTHVTVLVYRAAKPRRSIHRKAVDAIFEPCLS